MARFIFLIIILLFLFGCGPTRSPQTLPKDNRMTQGYTQITTEDLARYEFSHDTFNSFRDQATQAMLRVSRPAIEKALGKEVGLSEDKELAVIYEKVLREVYPEEDWIEPLSKLYARIFTSEEINEILTFYQSNTGRHLLEMQPTIMQEAEKMAITIFKNKEKKFAERLEEELSPVLSSTTKDLDSRSEDTWQLYIAETIQACKAIQESPEIPVGCAFDFYEGRPAVTVIFQNYTTTEQYWEAMLDTVAGPFCQAAREAKKQAIVIIRIQPVEMARMFSCETNEWSEWFGYKK